jgi:plasmid stabilization system protein ParE
MAQGFLWYEERRSGLGEEFLQEIRARLNLIEENPLRHAVVHKTARQTLVRRFPYKVFYVFENDRVEVLAVVHAKRDPTVWQKRV